MGGGVQEVEFTGVLSEGLEGVDPLKHADEDLEGATGMFVEPLWLGNWVLVALCVLPMWWYWASAGRRRKMGVLFAAITILLGVIFIRILPNWFLGL